MYVGFIRIFIHSRNCILYFRMAMFLSYTGICVWYMCKLPTLFLNVSTCCDLDKNDMKCSCFVLMFISPFICMLSPGALQIPKSIVAYLQVCIHEQHTGGFDGRWADFICLQDEPYGYVHLGIPGIIKCQPFKWDPSSFFFWGGVLYQVVQMFARYPPWN